MCSGEATAKVTAWVAKHYTGSLHIEVRNSWSFLSTIWLPTFVPIMARKPRFVALRRLSQDARQRKSASVCCCSTEVVAAHRR